MSVGSRLWMIAVLVFAVGVRLDAQPTDEQILAAAENPTAVGAALDACETVDQMADAIVAMIEEIQQGDEIDDRQRERIALVVGHAVVHLDERAAAVMGLVSARIDQVLLPVVTAAAVYSAGYRSPEVYAAILNAAGTTPEMRELIEYAAGHPEEILGKSLIERLPVIPFPQVAPAPPSPLAPNIGDIPLEVPPYRGQ